MNPLEWHATTILSVRRGDRVAIGGDGQVTLGTTVMKADAVKVRRLLDGQVLVGFAGSAADGFALMERFEAQAEGLPEQRPPRRDRAGQAVADRPRPAAARGDAGRLRRPVQPARLRLGRRDPAERRHPRHRLRAAAMPSPRRGP